MHFFSRVFKRIWFGLLLSSIISFIPALLSGFCSNSSIITLNTQIYLYCAAIPDQMIQVRVLKYDSLDSLPYGMCHRIFKKSLILRSWAWHATPFFLGLRNFRKNFNFFDFRFLGLNDRKYVETCPTKKFLRKN